MTEFKVIFVSHGALQFVSICSASNKGAKFMKSPGQKDVQSPNACKEAQGKETHCHAVCDKVSTLQSWQEGSRKALEILTILVSATQLAPEIWDVLQVIHLCYKLFVYSGHSVHAYCTHPKARQWWSTHNFRGLHFATPCNRAQSKDTVLAGLSIHCKVIWRKTAA